MVVKRRTSVTKLIVPHILCCNIRMWKAANSHIWELATITFKTSNSLNQGFLYMISIQFKNVAADIIIVISPSPSEAELNRIVLFLEIVSLCSVTAFPWRYNDLIYHWMCQQSFCHSNCIVTAGASLSAVICSRERVLMGNLLLLLTEVFFGVNLNFLTIRSESNWSMFQEDVLL